MAILERKEPRALKNSAVYDGPAGDGVAGILDERPHALAFLAAAREPPLFELPYRSIERIRMSFLRPNRMTIAGDSAKHRLRLTGALIDGEAHGESEWIAGSSPTELEYDRTRRAAEETFILLNAGIRILEWLAADRVRRRRIRGRILAARG